MCGIVAGLAQRDISKILIEGLHRLEYRGYDSAGVAVIDPAGELRRARAVGKVRALEDELREAPLSGAIGVAHTRWATHGRPAQHNAHPHLSSERVAVVHNGIIENHEALRGELEGAGYVFTSETDTEVVAHLVDRELCSGLALPEAVNAVTARLDGAFALAVMEQRNPELLVGARQGSPLVVGVGIDEHFIASDPLALLPVTDRFIYLDEGDMVAITPAGIQVLERTGDRDELTPVTREVVRYEHSVEAAGKGEYRHFMMKEIMEQPRVLSRTLAERLDPQGVRLEAFDVSRHSFLAADNGAEKGKQVVDVARLTQLFADVRQVQIIACGTSYHAGMVARYWLEEVAGIPAQVEVASEFRYRERVAAPGTLFLTLSQSGETADTLAALRDIQKLNREGPQAGHYLASLAICNVAGSSLVRESDLSLLTHAGPEIGVASTKAFTTQLVALMLTTLALRQAKGDGQTDDLLSRQLLMRLKDLPHVIEQSLALDGEIAQLAEKFMHRHHTLFLGRGSQYPIAMEGALKLKEISYIHAEAYAAGELKHGPLALIDEDMPVVAVAPMDDLMEKLKSNLQEVRARGGQLFVFADPEVSLKAGEGVHVVTVPGVCRFLAPIVYAVPLQLLSYHVAVLKGTDVDQPRNLAKSVTVE
ncbi:glutamine--fructose-6-phosphate transaminase (isomerizing) [Cobetia amphilecti]|jgi:glucosamine--fructose-6-phosphate aminotransferase (isomerizing)|uniref:Glutamine--fructose-6-phosphate aminotransferase [isomerizing] n=1 Tax=Cobetia amphilecti TaxID=1055104 RepID=A0ABT6URR7_9GAMM|nr:MULTISPECIES: glutamine--fructose-6-phosphate transaminase (isomerizing) [Cobetia]MDH2297411.1 glutamine--fructose-6-phosphate transaminase (isomerizing) [Cobetia sp. 29-18-1]MDI5884504.1 glutamine--fructose-6-phosphate transaminase (isomerizing) [Cobetia amphilecti]